MPTSEKSRVPATRKQAQSRSARASAGTAVVAQTKDSSSAVRVIEEKCPVGSEVTHRGIGLSAGRRQTA